MVSFKCGLQPEAVSVDEASGRCAHGSDAPPVEVDPIPPGLTSGTPESWASTIGFSGPSSSGEEGTSEALPDSRDPDRVRRAEGGEDIAPRAGRE